MSFDETILWPALAEAGMLTSALVKQSGLAKVTVNVGFRRPGEVLPIGIISTEYEIEYPTTDLPRLTEGDAVTIGAEKFRVRSTPLPQGDGYFSIAPLTKA